MRLKSISGSILTVLLVLLNVSAVIAESALEAALRGQGQPVEVIRQLQGLSELITERNSAKDRRGVKVLLAGPRNAAKVKTAQNLASKVGMTLYHIDLSSVVGKYIGETEKNLNRVLARAEESNMILFLDEADSLFGKRTDGSGAHDRYTNQNSEYILQRIESFKGVVIISSNQQQQLPTTRFDARILLASLPSFGNITTNGRKAINNSM